MIYVDNDWYSNFNNSVKSNDDKNMASMLADAISTLISKLRPEVIDLVKKADIVIPNEPSNEQISDIIVQKIGSNNKLRVGIAYLIAKEKGILASSQKQYSRVEGANEKEIEKELDGETTKKKRKIDWTKTASTVGSIANSISAITDSLAQSRNGQNQFKQNITNGANNKAPEYSGGTSVINNDTPPPPPKSKKKLYIGLAVVGVLAIVGVIGYKKGWFGRS
tara:strand:+ start:1976 stop:2641 length:666 start_codon:yes stop_codon:yes gene_type:complete